jgi:type II secretory pathway pseudopilin PulG
LRRLAKSEGGFGLIELLIAMTVMVIAIMAIVAAFSSGLVALNRASRTSTAGVLADKQMEAYRKLQWNNILLLQTQVAGVPCPASACPAPYATDSALAGSSQSGNFDLTDTLLGSTACGGTPTPVTCLPVQPAPAQPPVIGPDHRSYRIDSYVVWNCAIGSLSTTSPYTTAAPGCTGATPAARPSKLVTVVVRDPSTPTNEPFRESSTFDQATG